MEVSEQLTGFELEDLMSWTVSNLQRPFREDFSLEKNGIIAEKESQIFGRRFAGFDGPKKAAPFFISKRALVAAPAFVGRSMIALASFFYNRRIAHMDTQNTSRQLRYLEEVRTPLHRAGFGTLPVEGEQLPVHWNGTPLCRITGKGSVFYRREDADTPQAEDALYRVEDIAAKTLEYMTAMEAAPQLKASGLDGDYRILADFGGTVLAGSPSKYGVQFVTWDWDYDRTGVVHGHYFMENYDGAKQDFATRSGLIQKEQLFSPEQLTEIFRCCADSVDEDFFELTDTQEEMIRGIQQQIRVCVPDLNERIRQQEEALERASQEQTM